MLLVSQHNQIVTISLLLLLQTHNSGVHVDGESNNNVKPNDYAKVVENDEKVSPDQLTTHDVDAHLDDNVPIIDYDQYE